jgi:hypothetical protein
VVKHAAFGPEVILHVAHNYHSLGDINADRHRHASLAISADLCIECDNAAFPVGNEMICFLRLVDYGSLCDSS